MARQTPNPRPVAPWPSRAVGAKLPGNGAPPHGLAPIGMARQGTPMSAEDARRRRREVRP